MRRGELGALEARPHAQPRTHLGPRRRRYLRDRDARQYVRSLAGRPQARSRHVEQPAALSSAQYLTTALLVWARSPDSDFFELIAEFARLDRVAQARIAGLVLDLVPLDGPQLQLPRNHAIPVHRVTVLQNRVRRLQLYAVLQNVRAGYGTLNGVAHIFAPFELDWFPALEVSVSTGGRLAGGERLTVFRPTPRFRPLDPIPNSHYSHWQPHLTNNYECPYDNAYHSFSCDEDDTGSGSESEVGFNEINRPSLSDNDDADNEG